MLPGTCLGERRRFAQRSRTSLRYDAPQLWAPFLHEHFCLPSARPFAEGIQLGEQRLPALAMHPARIGYRADERLDRGNPEGVFCLGARLKEAREGVVLMYLGSREGKCRQDDGDDEDDRSHPPGSLSRLGAGQNG